MIKIPDKWLLIRCLAILLLLGLLACSESKQETAKSPADKPFTGRIIAAAGQTLASSGGRITLDLSLPPGYHFTDEAPSSLEWSTEPSGLLLGADGVTNGKLKGIMFPYSLPVTATSGTGTVQFEITAFFCEDETKVCQFEKLRLTAPVTISPEGSPEIVLSAEIEPPSLQ